ncbi:hypothetical protein [Marinobacter sp. HL-58]|uniref:hypothetical protein n=1 Tax=Marinobacter sp. HL-58 TaxID=1479237 RepID=UPI000486214E|nr:hypothetical protein [Marinobacter sp. HL-58]KPP97813.1 MAG: hypothetical protein HLUCCO03_09255 [Marinobacter sp. HL-58]
MHFQSFRNKADSIAGRSRQKGASALEYLVLAAGIIIVLGFLAGGGGFGDTVESAFEDLFQEASDTGNGE